MRLNENVRIVGQSVVLMPYKKEYVPKYHEWMKSEELQRLTASEPLTLAEEYEMQTAWRNDEDKLTFIILDKSKLAENEDEIEAMVGDTNLFLSHDQDTGNLHGEIEIMIAKEAARGKGFGWESILIMLHYGIEALKIKCFVAKIGIDNQKSLQMFGKLDFREESRSTIFNEITLLRECDPTLSLLWQKFFPKETLDFEIISKQDVDFPIQ